MQKTVATFFGFNRLWLFLVIVAGCLSVLLYGIIMVSQIVFKLVKVLKGNKRTELTSMSEKMNEQSRFEIFKRSYIHLFSTSFFFGICAALGIVGYYIGY